MDRFRVSFKCIKEPKAQSGLEGYELNKSYVGRSYNGLFEISSRWGDGGVTKVVEKQTFNQYFEVI